MKKLCTVSLFLLTSFVFGQGNNFRSGNPSYLIPTQQEQDNLMCNSYGTRQITYHGGFATVRCTGSDGNFFLYAKHLGGGNGNGSRNDNHDWRHRDEENGIQTGIMPYPGTR